MIVINMKSITTLASCSLVTMAANAAVLPSNQTNSEWFKSSALNVTEKTQQVNKEKSKAGVLSVSDTSLRVG